MKKSHLTFCMTLCSRRRPALVARALDAIASQTIPENVHFSVLLVENDSEPQYAPIVERYQDRLDIHYEVEPKPGLANVRNRALDTAEKLGVNWIGSIDDDVVIPQDWLTHMVTAIGSYPDTKVFYGNWIRHNHPDEPAWHPKTHHYNKNATGRIIKVSSFNNIAAKADVFAQSGMALRFDPRFNFIGGEDTDFTRSYLKQGGIIRSVHEALAEEFNDEARASLTQRLYRASSSEYSSAVIRHKHESKLVATFWNLQTLYRCGVLGTLNMAAGGVLLPIDKQLGLKFYAEGRRFFARIRGVFRYYFGSDLELYRDDAA